MPTLSDKEKDRWSARHEINDRIADLVRDLEWAETNPEGAAAHTRQNRVLKTMRQVERAVLNYGRLL